MYFAGRCSYPFCSNTTMQREKCNAALGPNERCTNGVHHLCSGQVADGYTRCYTHFIEDMRAERVDEPSLQGTELFQNEISSQSKSCLPPQEGRPAAGPVLPPRCKVPGMSGSNFHCCCCLKLNAYLFSYLQVLQVVRHPQQVRCALCWSLCV